LAAVEPVLPARRNRREFPEACPLEVKPGFSTGKAARLRGNKKKTLSIAVTKKMWFFAVFGGMVGLSFGFW
jgi:hypothetical protein